MDKQSYMLYFLWDVIAHLYPYLNTTLIKQKRKLELEWIISSHIIVDGVT